MFYNCGLPPASPALLLTLKYFIAIATILVTTAFLTNWCHNLRVGIRPNPVKLLLMASTFTCFWYSTSTVSNLVVAYAYFELFHDIQYLTIVWAFNRNRVTKDRSLGGFTRFLFRPRMGLILLYLLLVSSYGLLDLGSKLMDSGTSQRLLFGFFLTTALLHYYFDGFIWKLREANTQSNLEIQESLTNRVRRRLSRGLGHRLMWGMLAIAFVGLTFTELSKRVAEASEDPNAMRERIATESQGWADAMPNSFRANYYAGLALEQQGNYPAAKRRYERALAILPEYTAAITGLARIVEEELLTETTASAHETSD
jgi:tetratricopeptide (TPR) repeat protein